MAKKSQTIQRLFMLLLGSVFIFACQDQKSKPPKAQATTNNSSGNWSNSTYDPLTQSAYTATVTSEIYMQGQTSSTSLVVVQNQPVTWVFDARNSSGTSGTITSISAMSQPANMVISGSTVTFTPNNINELSGSLTVNATVGTESISRTFTWSNNGTLTTTNSSDNSSAFMLAMMTGVLSAVTGQPMMVPGYVNGYGGMGGYSTMGMVNQNYNSTYGNQYNSQYGNQYGNSNYNGYNDRYRNNYNSNSNTVNGNGSYGNFGGSNGGNSQYNAFNGYQ